MKNSKMKKSLSLILSLIMIMSTLSILTVTSFAETSGDWEYVVDNNEASITTYKGSAANVTIPSKLDGYSVTSIGGSAFSGCTSLESVTIPNSVTSIGRVAFFGCTSLTSVTIGNGVTSIGEQAFYNCTSLTSVTIGNSVTSIGRVAFFGCTSLTNITIPDSVTIIGDHAFYDCTSLKSVTLGNSVTSIDRSAFFGCTSLTIINVDGNNPSYCSVNGILFNKDKSILIAYLAGKKDKQYSIPDSVTSIGDYAFFGCTSLTSITIPNSVTSIGSLAFRDCTSLTSINVDGNNPSYCSVNGVLFNKDKSELIQYPAEKKDKQYSIPDSVTSIGDSAFSGCTSLTSVTIPNSVTIIGDDAFYYCTSLTSITIPDSVTSIGDFAFYDCKSLTSVTIGNSVTSIGIYAFGYYYDNTLDSLRKINDFKIYGRKGTEAENYAKNYDFQFIEIGTFPDVKKSDWYYDVVQYNAQKGFITGYQNGKFGPNDSLKRQDFVCILARIDGADLKAYENVQSKLTDVKKGDYYAAAVNWAVDKGYISGYQNGKFGVNDSITREQVATILYNYMGKPEVKDANKILAKFPDANKVSSFAKTPVAWAVSNGIISGMGDGTVASTSGATRAQIAAIIQRMDTQGMFSK